MIWIAPSSIVRLFTEVIEPHHGRKERFDQSSIQVS